MTNWRARARLLAFACVAGLALSGCGDEDGGGQNDGTNGDSADQAGGDGEELSPLEEYMGENSGFANGGGRVIAFASSAEASEEERQQMRQVEELVAACMEEAGFDYVPVDPFGGAVEDDPFADAYALPPDEFAREYGYGMTTLMNPDKGEEEAPADPNQEIRDGLSEAALEAYNRALWGEMAEITDGGGAVAIKPTGPEGEPPSLEEQGCHGQARAEVFGEDGGLMQGADMSEFDGLFEDLEALRQRIDSDARLVEATEAWAACMAEAGYSEFDTTTAPEDSVMERMSELYGWDDEPSDDASSGPSVTVGGPEEVDVDEEALAELQEYEIALATADYECEQQEYADVQQEVAWGFEEDFVEEHRAELERYRDAMAEGPVGNAGGVG
ncbi:hypothetical protein E1262_25510 [Jiangella aurantiaca]|uniref:Uncharacterized protein n=1 Tax=Jiangella aurantiaca TaxID=2530373 RepID=A0A4R5A0P3_9ACTN|nr:hypothetical protein [Jiangella aurantiaca]TDD65333.1 hypothetical protein E1262_25510 [Jiangella aurantiaca]